MRGCRVEWCGVVVRVGSEGVSLRIPVDNCVRVPLPYLDMHVQSSQSVRERARTKDEQWVGGVSQRREVVGGRGVEACSDEVLTCG